MNVPRDSASPSVLYCEICDFQQFTSYSEFHLHHLSHIRQPRVKLVKLNPKLWEKLKLHSYKVNTGVARRSWNHVSPLKISLKKQGGRPQFRVVKAEKLESGNSSPRTDNFSQDFRLKINNPRTIKSESKSESKSDAWGKTRAVEGKNLLERLGATISVSRKGIPVLTKVKDEPIDEENNSNQSNVSNHSNDSNGSAKSAPVKSQAESLLERFQVKGITISQKPKVLPANGNPQSSPQPQSPAPEQQNCQIGKIKTIDINQLRNIKPAGSPAPEKKSFVDKSLLEKLTNSGLIVGAPKKLAKPESPKINEESEEEGKDEEGERKVEESEDSGKNDEENEKSDVELSVKLNKNGSQDGYDSSDSKSNLNEESKTEENSKSGNESEGEPQKRIRVKNSLLKKDFGEKKTSDAGSSSEEQESNFDKDDEDTRGSGFNILKGLTDDLAVGLDKQGATMNLNFGSFCMTLLPLSAEDYDSTIEYYLVDNGIVNAGENSSNSKSPVMEEANLPPSPPPSEKFEQARPDFIAPPSECNSPAVGESDNTNNETIQNENPPDCSLLMTPPSSTQDSSDGSSNYNTVSHEDSYANKNFEETPTINEEEQNQDISFNSLQNEDQSQVTGEEQPTYWSDVRDTTVDQPQQDPLMTGDGSAGNGEMTPNFLQNFLNEPDGSHNPMPPEGSEFVSYDSLAHQQQAYNTQGPDPNAPMEQLSQQVNRMPNPPVPGQINVIPQHHMQAPPPPPQLHPGMPISPQHMGPQQPNQYDPMGHMQPQMPPLYQGYNMFNQNYTPQAPQMPPRPPPMLQQMPQQRITPRSFQSMAAIPQRAPRPRAFPMKRNMVRLPGPQELTPPKVRRVEPAMQRQQMQQNTVPAVAKIPSGITITPPKKTVEANKAANVLAARGITVTPAANRQQQQNRQVQQAQQQRVANQQSPIINLGSSISITPSSQNRSSGGFAVPGPRRNSAFVVNHNVERPEQCATVDLTLDDEPSQMQRNRLQQPQQMGRLSCNQCPKIFTTQVALESHKASHRAAGALPFKCDRCTAQYPTAVSLQQHKLTFHKANKPAPDFAIPIVDLNHPGAKDQLSKCGIHSFLPLSQLQSNSNGYFGIPIINLDSAKEKAVSNLNILGAGNIFVLGKMKALPPAPNR